MKCVNEIDINARKNIIIFVILVFKFNKKYLIHETVYIECVNVDHMENVKITRQPFDR